MWDPSQPPSGAELFKGALPPPQRFNPQPWGPREERNMSPVAKHRSLNTLAQHNTDGSRLGSAEASDLQFADASLHSVSGVRQPSGPRTHVHIVLAIRWLNKAAL